MTRFAALALAVLLACAPTADATTLGTVGASSARAYGFGIGGPAALGFSLANSGANITLSPDTFTATKITANSWQTIRTATTHTSGKFYAEFQANTAACGTGDGGFGASRAAWTPTGFYQGQSGSPTGALGIRCNGFGDRDGVSWCSGCADLVWTNPSWGFIAVDVTNSLVWVKKQGGTNWNNSGTADPATGVGGLSLSGSGAVLLGGMFFAFSPADVIVINTGKSAFVGTPPAGYSPWG